MLVELGFESQSDWFANLFCLLYSLLRLRVFYDLLFKYAAWKIMCNRNSTHVIHSIAVVICDLKCEGTPDLASIVEVVCNFGPKIVYLMIT